MEFNVLKTIAGTGGRLIATAVAGGVVSLLLYVAFDAGNRPEGSSVLIKPKLTQAEYETLRARCSQTETPAAETTPITAEAAQLEAAALSLCEQLERGEGFTIIEE
ncbi:MAG: hypothetical protein AAFU71_18275 [Cyanobacteria bacterium J06632_22]